MFSRNNYQALDSSYRLKNSGSKKEVRYKSKKKCDARLGVKYKEMIFYPMNSNNKRFSALSSNHERRNLEPVFHFLSLPNVFSP